MVSKEGLFRLAIPLLCLLLLLISYGYVRYVQPLYQPTGAPVQLWVITPGQSAGTVIEALEAKGILGNTMGARGLFRLNPALGRFQAGTYELTPQMRPVDIFSAFSQGAVKQFYITLVEGQTWRQWRNSLARHPHIAAHGFDEPGLKQRLGVAHLEGRLLPQTYAFTDQTPMDAIVQRAFDGMSSLLNQAWAGRQADLPLKSPYEALILASIVEKETALASERPLIAGVFINRLNKGMRLQTDPTVIYGIGEDFDGNLTRAHLRQKTPYNTYRINGLPPTPIAMVGAEALHAVLHPLKTEALYFVARGDGSHVFSNTLTEHNRAVRRYQLGMKD